MSEIVATATEVLPDSEAAIAEAAVAANVLSTERMPRTRRLAMVTVIAAATVGGAHPHDPTPIRQALVQEQDSPLSVLGPGECPPATSRAVAAARRLINEPEDPDFAVQDKWLDQQEMQAENRSLAGIAIGALGQNQSRVPVAVTRRLYLEKQFRVAADAAHKLGETVYDPTPYLLKIDQMKREPATPFRDYLDTAQAYMSQFGVTVRLATPNDGLSHDLHAANDDDLEASRAKLNMRNLIVGFSAMPKGYLKLDGLKTIILAASPNTAVVAYAQVNGNHDTIVANMSYTLQPDVYRHENQHLEDAAQCGGDDAMYRDPSYAQNNVGNVYNPKIEPANAEDMMQSSKITGLEDIISDDIVAGEYDAACAARRRIDSALSPVSLPDEYAGNNVVEDKAETGKYIASPGDWSTIINSETPRVRAKFTELLARLWQYRPRLAEYFASIATRTQPVNPCDNRTGSTANTGS